jgi:hypothetical protein
MFHVVNVLHILRRSIITNSGGVSGIRDCYNFLFFLLFRRVVVCFALLGDVLDDKNCKLSTLDDYIERAPKDQRGKNGHLRLVTYLLLSLLLNTSNLDLIFRCLPPEYTIVC